jgi:hypothetical protein
MSYEVLSEHAQVHNGSVTLTIHYMRDGVQKSCIYLHPETMQVPVDFRAHLDGLLAQDKDPTGPFNFNSQGGSLG